MNPSLGCLFSLPGGVTAYFLFFFLFSSLPQRSRAGGDDRAGMSPVTESSGITPAIEPAGISLQITGSDYYGHKGLIVISATALGVIRMLPLDVGSEPSAGIVLGQHRANVSHLSPAYLQIVYDRCRVVRGE